MENEDDFKKKFYEVFLRPKNGGLVKWGMYGIVPEIVERAEKEVTSVMEEPCEAICYRVMEARRDKWERDIKNAPRSRGEILQEDNKPTKAYSPDQTNAQIEKGQS